MELDDEIRRMVDAHGWAVQGVADENPAYCVSYTVGLTAVDHPELVMTGLAPREAYDFFQIACPSILAGKERLVAGESTQLMTEDRPLPVIAVVDTADLTAVWDVYGKVDALQIVWTDSNDVLPWEAGYQNPPEWQPLLGPQESKPS